MDAGAPAGFTVSEKFGAGEPITQIRWESAPARLKGDRVTHRFAKPGQYFVRATGIGQKGTKLVSEEVTVFVGFKKEPDLVCRLLMKGTPRDSMKSWIWYSGWDKANTPSFPTPPAAATPASWPAAPGCRMTSAARCWN